MQKEKVLINVEEVTDEGSVKPRQWRTNLFAAVICLVLAVAVWVVIMGRPDSDYLRLELRGGNDAFEYELSASVLEVEGKVSDLRHAAAIQVYVPKEITEPGEYKLDGTDLVLPNGVALTGELSLTLKVKTK